jgi:hypothetical protein
LAARKVVSKSTMKRLPADDPRVLRIKQAAREGRFELAPQDRVATMPTEVQRVLDALGFPEALVTDLSSVQDFDPTGHRLNAAAEALGFDVGPEALIVDVALKLRSFTCPKCHGVSHNPNDVANRYCGACHWFVGDEVALWLDDLRPMPDGYQVWAKTVREALAVLRFGKVLRCSLDHDLCDEHMRDAINGYHDEFGVPRDRYKERTGYDVLLWMAEHDRWCPDITVHTHNPVGERDMTNLLRGRAPASVQWRARRA